MRSHNESPGADPRAFEELFERHHVAVCAYAIRRVGRDNAADVVQETFAVAWRRPDKVPAEALPWLLGVARRVVLREWRSVSRRTALETRVATEARRASGRDDATADDAEAVTAAIERLGERDREVLALVYWDGLSCAEAAVVLGCSQVAARVRLHRARQRLAALLESDRGGVAVAPAVPVYEEVVR